MTIDLDNSTPVNNKISSNKIDNKDTEFQEMADSNKRLREELSTSKL